MKETEPRIPHVQLSDDVDAGILTQEEANKIAEEMNKPKGEKDAEENI